MGRGGILSSLIFTSACHFGLMRHSDECSNSSHPPEQFSLRVSMCLRGRHHLGELSIQCAQFKRNTNIICHPSSYAQVLLLIHEATAEMMRRDTHQEDVVSQLRRELRYYHHHAEGQPEEYEETRTANASIAAEVVRLQAREAQLSTGRCEVKRRSYKHSC